MSDPSIRIARCESTDVERGEMMINKGLGVARMPRPGERACRVCHCTEDNPCFSMAGYCYWVEADLCSECKSESGEAGG